MNADVEGVLKRLRATRPCDWEDDLLDAIESALEAELAEDDGEGGAPVPVKPPEPPERPGGAQRTIDEALEPCTHPEPLSP